MEVEVKNLYFASKDVKCHVTAIKSHPVLHLSDVILIYNVVWKLEYFLSQC
jgi:hypothetical protein